MRENEERDLAGAALRGAIAGVIGGLVMKAVLAGEERALLPRGEHYDGGSRAVVRRMEKKTGIQLGGGAEGAAALGVHLAYTGLWGAIHGVGAELLGIQPFFHGLVLGGVAYLTSVGPKGFLTRLGVTPSPMLQPMAEAAMPVGAHVAYGLATAASYNALS